MSVVIPTRQRPALVVRAVRSVLRQTRGDLETLVVIDGPDAETRAALAEVVDSRLHVIELPAPLGGSAARNAGVARAAGEWVAFLDDDDEWMPEKLETQLALAHASSRPRPIVTSRLIARSPHGDFLWPRRLPAAGEPVSEYLFARNTPFQGEGVIQTSTLVARRELLLACPFRPGLRKHQDWDWLVRALALPGVAVEFAAEPLAVWYVDEARPSVSRTSSWRTSLDWIRESRPLVTPRAYAGFIASQVSWQAARERAWCAFLPLTWEMMRVGRPGPFDVLTHLTSWLVPGGARRRVRAAFTRRLAPAGAAAPSRRAGAR